MFVSRRRRVVLFKSRGNMSLKMVIYSTLSAASIKIYPITKISY